MNKDEGSEVNHCCQVFANFSASVHDVHNSVDDIHCSVGDPICGDNDLNRKLG